MIDDIDQLYGRPARDRYAAGLAHRSEVPLGAHATVPTEDRRADPLELLTAQDEMRQPDLVPIRHGRMGATPFTFYRGAAAVMAADLSLTPTTDLRVQLCGDAHLSNFGIFKSPDRRMVFDLNDFDETTPGPFEWDLKRLAASITVAGRDNGISPTKTARSTRAAVRGYRETIVRAAAMSPLEVHYHRLEVNDIVERLGEKRPKSREKALAKAHRKDSMRALDKLTEVVGDRRVIVPDPPVITRVDELLEHAERDNLVRFLHDYVATLPPHRRVLFEHYRYIDMAHKVVGVGSVGTRCLVLLTESGEGEPLFLQLKEATRSVLEPYVGASGFEQAGERVVRGQQLMQSTGDVFLGWARYRSGDGRRLDFYFRQLWDGKGSAEIEDMGGGRLTRYAWFCGATLALAHARSSDAALLAGYVDDEALDHALEEFASGYADLTERDHAAHRAAIHEGRIAAVDDL